MIDIETQLLDQDPGWREVLEAYRPVEAVRDEVPRNLSGDELPGEERRAVDDESLEELTGPETEDRGMAVRLADLSVDDSNDGGWLPRITSLEGVDDETLSRIHGRLIAMGWLGFEVAGRTVGVRYRMTRDGCRVLDGIVPVPTLHVVEETPETVSEE